MQRHYSAELFRILSFLELHGPRLVIQARDIVRIAAVFTCIVKFHFLPPSLFAALLFALIYALLSALLFAILSAL